MNASHSPAESLPVAARDAIRQLRASRIREVANAGFGVPDVLPFWFGESDRVTPDFIREAANEALSRGATFYTHNLGIAGLRSVLADYVSALHGRTTMDQVAVTSAGVNALMLAAQLVVGPGDRAVAVTPLWPNVVEIPKILGARIETVSLDYGPQGWTLDVDKLLAALTPGTRLLTINSPSNPTGWVMPRDAQQAVLEHCRRHGIWILADEVYERLYYGAQRAAPSFLDLADREERIICVNSFSKSWLMTGWRLGWMVLPPSRVESAGKLLEFNSSCAPVFVQRGALAALAMADDFVPGLVARLRAGRDRLHDGLGRLPGVTSARPLGGMYAWFRVEGEADSLAFAKRLVRDHGLGLAPGAAFGDEGEGWLRWCFASQDPARLDEGLRRLAGALPR